MEFRCLENSPILYHLIMEDVPPTYRSHSRTSSRCNAASTIKLDNSDPIGIPSACSYTAPVKTYLTHEL
nr:unnamed protein product [Spirometra erinaceieuropaei]